LCKVPRFFPLELRDLVDPSAPPPLGKAASSSAQKRQRQPAKRARLRQDAEMDELRAYANGAGPPIETTEAASDDEEEAEDDNDAPAEEQDDDFGEDENDDDDGYDDYNAEQYFDAGDDDDDFMGYKGGAREEEYGDF
jgi:DNA-directed RNA polymerase III subunit RPC7